MAVKLREAQVGDSVQITALVVREGPGNQVLLRIGGVGHSGTWSLHHDVECTVMARGIVPPEMQEEFMHWVRVNKS